MQAHRRPGAGLIAPSLFSALFAGGCTTVVIHTDGAVKTETRFGIVHLNLDPAHTTAITLTSFGVVSLPGSTAIGYTRWQGVGLPAAEADRCLLVTFDPPQQTGVEK
ncbi:MAG: hypothetical protein JSR69_00270 [Proteobacteria bacterium]|nr:hypothetical protein [Pseudomonadota bacterium]